MDLYISFFTCNYVKSHQNHEAKQGQFMPAKVTVQYKFNMMLMASLLQWHEQLHARQRTCVGVQAGCDVDVIFPTSNPILFAAKSGPAKSRPVPVPHR